MVGFSVHLIAAYFDHSIGMDAGINAVKTQNIIATITALKTPYLIMADFNATPQEAMQSMLFRFLGAKLLVPNVPFTCASTSSEGGRAIDFGMIDPWLEEYTTLETYDACFRPHLLTLRVIISQPAGMDIGRV